MAQASNDGWAMRSTFTRPDRGGPIRVIGHFLAHFVVIVTFRDHPQRAYARVRKRAARLEQEAQLRRAAEQDEFYEGPED